MRREIIICCVCLGLAALILAGRTGYQFYQADQARKQEQIRRAAMATAMTQARAELARQQEAQRLAAVAGTPAARPPAAAGSRPGAATPAAPAGDPDVTSFLGQAKINSVLLGSPSIVVINKQDYEEGHQIILPHGKRLTVKRIADDDVTFTGADGQTYRLARK